MQDIFFSNADEVPLPPDEVRIRLLEAIPRPDGQRIDVRTEITPFQQRPNVELSIRNPAGEEVATLSVVEAIDHKMDFTMHLRETHSGGAYSLEMRVFYANIEEHEAEEGGQIATGDILDKARQVVDERQAIFHIPT